MVGETAKKLDHFLLEKVLLLLLLMLFSLHTTRWGATASSIQLDNGTRTALDYQGRMEEPELLFDSEISRMLVDYQGVTRRTKSPNKPAVSRCGRLPRYKSCLPDKTGSKPKEKCVPYKRKC